MSSPKRYAASTSVPEGRSREEIERTLSRYGVRAFGYAAAEGRAMIEFATDTRRVRFVLGLPSPDELRFTRTPTGRPRAKEAAATEHAQAVRQVWRALALVVKAKLEAVAAGIVDFETEFLAHTVLPSGRTVAEELTPQIEAAYTEGRVDPLQIESGR